MKVEIKEVDLVKAFESGDIDVAAHCCNCYHTWGSGVAKSLKAAFPRAFNADLLTPYGDPKKLGQFSCALFDKQIICNLYGQFKYGRTGVFLNDTKFFDALINMRDFLVKMGYKDITVGFPYMVGCGTAGGDWKKIQPMIEYVFGETYPIMFCKFNP
jgi:O-acetyl-ADP-ribose deacetylase (regulator of RNase III)